MRASPVGQPPRRRHSSTSSGPAARWMAPSTPPPPRSEVLAAFTMACTESVVMSAWMARSRVGMLGRGSARLGQSLSAPFAHPSRGRDVGVHPEEIRLVVDGLELAQARVVLAEGGADLLRPIVGGEVIDVGAALQVRLHAVPDAPYPLDVASRSRAILPLPDGIEVPLRPPSRESGGGRRDARGCPVHVEEDEGAERRAEGGRGF